LSPFLADASVEDLLQLLTAAHGPTLTCHDAVWSLLLGAKQTSPNRGRHVSF